MTSITTEHTARFEDGTHGREGLAVEIAEDGVSIEVTAGISRPEYLGDLSPASARQLAAALLGFTDEIASYVPVSFAEIGDAVAFRIVSLAETSTHTVISGETYPGDETSRVTLWVPRNDMHRAIAEAVLGEGRDRLALGDDMAVTRTGEETYSAAYSAAPE